MNVLGISGSMRKNGNTAQIIKYILDRVREEGIETEFISLADRVIKPCTGCELCKDRKWCTAEDDDWEGVINRVMECEVLIIGSPTYYYDVSGHLKNFIDRTYSLYHDRKLAGRKAIGVTVCADRGCERALETIEAFLNTHEFSYLGYVCGKGYAPGDIMKDERAIKKADEAAARIVNMLKPSD